ncbi:hypothetical protein BGZ61DRAFT_36034 [Ilyonectria robusta]|uniref:uncharacterized protein n=1 Tax=Ilyonectria robusta TaxID=1079257 RepID=UPI001E8D08DD|nr:uncharacterized protein BGZ61DRAFT_36034 [Ilyonectria robusta]KAH8694786.1 hypothetical protein BGZ61DRAFT_36034 [Ilyonectria robusta]
MELLFLSQRLKPLPFTERANAKANPHRPDLGGYSWLYRCHCPRCIALLACAAGLQPWNLELELELRRPLNAVPAPQGIFSETPAPHRRHRSASRLTNPHQMGIWPLTLRESASAKNFFRRLALARQIPCQNGGHLGAAGARARSWSCWVGHQRTRGKPFPD